MNTIMNSSFAVGLLLGKETFSKTSFCLNTSCPGSNIELSVLILFCRLSNKFCLLVIIFLNNRSCIMKSPSAGSPHCWTKGLNNNWLRVSPCAPDNWPLFRELVIKGNILNQLCLFNDDASTILFMILLVIRIEISACPRTWLREGIVQAWTIEWVARNCVNFRPNSGPPSVRAILKWGKRVKCWCTTFMTWSTVTPRIG